MLKLKRDQPLSSFGFKFNLRRFSKQILNEMRTLCDNPNAPGRGVLDNTYDVESTGISESKRSADVDSMGVTENKHSTDIESTGIIDDRHSTNVESTGVVENKHSTDVLSTN